jgi:hypothetical protein
MFYGSIPAEVQSMMGKIVKSWDVTDVYVGCSGNFTCEKLIFPMQKFGIHSNDVTLYSKCLGEFYTSKPVELELSSEGKAKFPWIAKYMESDEDKIATLMLATRLVTFEGKDNPFYQNMLDEYIKQWATLHKTTKAKVEANEMRVRSYYNGDVMEFIDAAPSDCGFVAYPPFENAGKAFVKDFAKLEKMFEFEPPEYAFFDKDSLLLFYEKMMEKKNWIFGTNIKLEDERFSKFLCGKSKTTNRGIPIYVYSNSGTVQIVTPNQDTEKMGVKRLMPGDEVGDTLTLYELSNEAFQTLRSTYMNINIRPGSATLALGVMADDKLVGVYAFSASPTLANWDKHIDTPTMYLLSDFPVAPTDYDRLAKLVLIAALSKESKMIAERIMRKRVRSLVTTAFSRNPVSMKYRGLFKLLTRKENKAFDEKWGQDIDPSNRYYNQPYEINYGAALGQWTLQEGLAIWKRKHGQKSGKKEYD